MPWQAKTVMFLYKPKEPVLGQFDVNIFLYSSKLFSPIVLKHISFPNLIF